MSRQRISQGEHVPAMRHSPPTSNCWTHCHQPFFTAVRLLTQMAQQAFGSSQAVLRPHASQPPSGTASAGVLPSLLVLASAAVMKNRSASRSTAADSERTHAA